MSTKNPTLNFIILHTAWETLSLSLEEDIVRALEKASQHLEKDFASMEVSVVLTDDKEVQKLNKKFRHQNKPTDVLSFSSQEKGELGDIILAYETVMQEAKESGTPALHHTLHLIIHGFLHLLGYDHEKMEEAEHMEHMEIQILKALNIKNPYEAQ